MVAKMYLQKDDLNDILKFMDAFPEKVTVEVTCDSSSGIGSTIHAHLHDVKLHGMNLTITKEIGDVKNW